MLKSMKRNLAAFSAGLMALSCVSTMGLNVLADIENHVQYQADDGLVYNSYSDHAEVVGVWKVQETYVVPEQLTIGTYTFPVTVIADNAFSGQDEMTEIKLPEGLTSIGEKAFQGCSNLTTIDLPDSLRYLSHDAFDGAACTYTYEDDNVFNAITYVDGWALYATEGAWEITIHEGTRGIAQYAFYGVCSTLEWVMFPKDGNLEIINEGAFYNDSTNQKLTNITLPYEGLKYIDAKAFYGLGGVGACTIPASVVSVGQQAFLMDNMHLINIMNNDCEIYDADDTITPGATIRGYADSAAEAYALKYDHPFELLYQYKDPSLLNPDINFDGVIDATDASYILLYSAESGAGLVSSFEEFWYKYFAVDEVEPTDSNP